MSDRDDEWVTYKQAARILGVHFSNVPKMVRRGDLTPHPTRRPSLRLADVIRLRDARAERARLRSLPPEPRPPKDPPQPPDREQPWVGAEVVARHMGVGVSAVHQRSRRGRLPFALGSDGRTRFYQLAQVDATLRAQVATRTRAVAPASVRGNVASPFTCNREDLPRCERHYGADAGAMKHD